MTVNEVKQAIGGWEVRLKEETPKETLSALTFYGHVAIVPGRLDPVQYGDNLLASARYVGVYRGRDAHDDYTLKGSGMAFWLGDEDDKGDVFETPVVLTGATFGASIPALLPAGGSITPGVINSVPGTYTGSHQWQTPRKALDYVTDLFGAEYRVNNDGTLDAGTVTQLYGTAPKGLLIRKDSGADLIRRAFAGRMGMGVDIEDVTTRVVLLAEGEGSSISTGDADAPPTSFKDIHGNPIRATRIISESGTSTDNASARAQLQLNRFLNARLSVSLSTNDFDVKGTFGVGDYLEVYDPDNGFVDPTREAYWKGERINPILLRCVEMSWPVLDGWTVAFRDINGNWIDLSPYYVPESGETNIVVGELSRGFASVGGGESVGSRPNLPEGGGADGDGAVPGPPTFTGFSPGSYQSGTTNTTKSALRVQWDTPLNVDSSTIQDGDHYEIRYRVNQVIGYSVDWDLLSGYNVDVDDTFSDRTTSNGWGASYTAQLGAFADFSVANSTARISHPTVNALRGITYSDSTYTDQSVLAGVLAPSAMPSGTSHVRGVLTNFIDSGNFYWFRLEFNVAGDVAIKATKRIAGTLTDLSVVSPVPGLTFTVGQQWWIRVTRVGNRFQMRIWSGAIGDEPGAWNFDFVDSSITSAGQVGLMDWLVGGNTNTLPFVTTYNEFKVTDMVSSGGYDWDELGTWDALISEPVEASQEWQTSFVGWGDNAFTIMELTPGVKYELQIRAVDSAVPPNQSAWSASSFVETLGDLIAPSTPAPPQVLSSPIAIQVIHRLGKASGGVFNLEPDIDRLSVHVSAVPAFSPTSANKVGELIATAGMVQQGIPAIGTFNIKIVGNIYVRIVAIDRAGNKSGPSDTVLASPGLIDDQYISNLSVSKLTAGTITASTVLAAQMEVANGGNLKLTDGSLQVFEGQTGVKKVEAGLMSDGTYDLAAVNPAGKLVSLSTLAFGMQADTAFGTFIPPSSIPTYIGGPTVFTRIGTSGRALFIISATYNLDTYPREGIAAYVEGNGPSGATMTSTVSLTMINDLEVAAGAGSFLGGALSLEISAADFSNSLTPGDWAFFLTFQDLSVGSVDGTTPGSPSCTKATLIVMPF